MTRGFTRKINLGPITIAPSTLLVCWAKALSKIARALLRRDLTGIGIVFN